MSRMPLGVMLAAAMGLGGRWSPAVQTPSQGIQDSTAIDVSTPPAPWIRNDPADSLYRAAREALDRRDYRKAADLFQQVSGKFPGSGYAADALYWRAFSLYRLGGTSQLNEALQSLSAQRQRFPQAATRGDAAQLELRIQGELGRRGDPARAAYVDSVAQWATQPVPPVPPVPPTPGVMPAPPTPPTPHGGSSRCENEEDDTRIAALSALQQMDDSRARPILQRVLARRDPGSVCLRRKAVFLIAQQEASGAEDILLETARTDPDQEVREQSVFWLSQVGTDKAVTALDSILRTSKDPSLQEKAVFALSQHEGARAQQALRGYAERADLPAETREKAIFWIGQQGGKDNEAFLRTLYSRIKEEDMREKVLFSVSQAGGKDNVGWLLGIAKDSSQPLELRKKALFWAGQSDAPIADLTSMYASTPGREMREQLVFVYSQRDEPAAVDKLIDIARRDSDPEIRKKALFWLGQSDDPRAAKALQDVIEQP
ncbi:MAG: HEAT repeat domain-containing protein [Gemmatimonadales bacterium]